MATLKNLILKNYSNYFDDLLSGERSLHFGLLVYKKFTNYMTQLGCQFTKNLYHVSTSKTTSFLLYDDNTADFFFVRFLKVISMIFLVFQRAVLRGEYVQSAYKCVTTPSEYLPLRQTSLVLAYLVLMLLSQCYCVEQVNIFDYMSLVVRKPVFWVSDQVRHKPGCTAA